MRSRTRRTAIALLAIATVALCVGAMSACNGPEVTSVPCHGTSHIDSVRTVRNAITGTLDTTDVFVTLRPHFCGQPYES